MTTETAQLTATAIVNNREVEFVLTEQFESEKKREFLISRGWDGRMWLGVFKAVGRRRGRAAIFHRRASDGKFVAVLILAD